MFAPIAKASVTIAALAKPAEAELEDSQLGMATFTLVVASSHPQDAIPEPSPCRYATV